MAKADKPASAAAKPKSWKPPVALPTISMMRYAPDSCLVAEALGGVKEDERDLRKSEPRRY